MAFSGTHVVCCFAGAAGLRGTVMSIVGKALWSETMAAAGTTGSAVPNGNQEDGAPMLRVRASADIFVAIGPAPNASTGPRYFVEAGKDYDFFPTPGDKLAWVAA